MPSVYGRYKDQLQYYFDRRPEFRLTASPDQVIDTEEGDADELAASPGGKVLAQSGTGTMPEFFVAFRNIFTEGAFQWVGSQGTSPTRVMETLDGARTSGECAILATAFWALWACPQPFGLGKSGATLITFDNNDDLNGFIAPHPPGGIRGLGPNIIHPHGDQGDPRNCLYVWGNHKVILHSGTYYDPTYRTTYNNTSEMVAFAFTGNEQNINGEAITEIRVVTANPTRGWKTGDRMYLRSDHLMRMVGPYRAIAGWQ